MAALKGRRELTLESGDERKAGHVWNVEILIIELKNMHFRYRNQ